MRTPADSGISRRRRLGDPGLARRRSDADDATARRGPGVVAADDPAYRLSAARVAYWLGKRDECDAHLAAALAAGGETCEAHFAVADVLASLGETGEARRHWEAAYGAAGDAGQRSRAAYSVAAVTVADPEAALVWYLRADASDPVVAAAKAACAGNVALLKGDLAEAERQLAASLAAYDRLPRNSASLNNAALVAAEMSGLTGRADTLRDACRRLRDALAEQPTNVVLLSNTASALSAMGWVRALPADVDLRFGVAALRRFRYDDAAGRDAVRAAAAASDEMREAARLLDRGLALAAGSATLLVQRIDLAADLGDDARLREILAQVRAGGIDTEALRATYAAAWSRAADPTAALAVRATLRARIDGLAADADPVLRTMLETSLVETSAAAAVAGAEIDLAALDATARRLHAEVPCAATREVERATAAVLVHGTLCRADRRYARESARTLMQVGPARLVAEALHRDPSLVRHVRGAPEWTRLLDLAEESGRKFPAELGAASRALLRAGGRDPWCDGAAPPAAASAAPPNWALESLCSQALQPFSASRALDAAWALRLTGDDAGAEAVLRDCARRGGAVPYLE